MYRFSVPSYSFLRRVHIWNKVSESLSSFETTSKQENDQVISPLRLSRSGIIANTRQIINGLKSAQSAVQIVSRLQELNKHISSYPDAIGLAVKEGALPLLLQLRDVSTDDTVKSYSRMALSLLGYADPPKGRGIRILSIDGGGTRGMVVLELLKKIVTLTGKPIQQNFDLICGVSTGAILTMLIGALGKTPDECDPLYSKFSKDLFVTDLIRGTGRLIWTHAYYDTSVWETILRGLYTEKILIETAQNQETPKLIAVSSLMNTPVMQPFVFRNFNLPDRSNSYYDGSCNYKLWEAVRASAAAPGYFQEFPLDNYIHQDGGIIVNNPTAVALHEAQLLWPNESVQCCLSIGSGRYTPLAVVEKDVKAASSTSLKQKLTRVIESATETEMVHRLLQDLLPYGTYFRLNPTIQEYYTLDENRPEKLDQMKTDAQMYMRKNEYKMKMAGQALAGERSYVQKLKDYVKLQYLLKT